MNRHIYKMYSALTNHITLTDSILLDSVNDDSCILSADKLPFGWLIYVDQDIINSEEEIRKEGFSQNFYELLMLAYDNDCTYLLLDRDEVPLEDVEIFNW